MPQLPLIFDVGIILVRTGIHGRDRSVGAAAMTMLRHDSGAQRSCWELILTGLLAFAFGIAAVLLPLNIIFRRILDVIFGGARPLSGSMTAVAVMLALVALVAVDGVINLFVPA